jgi:hypothetical protein
MAMAPFCSVVRLYRLAQSCILARYSRPHGVIRQLRERMPLSCRVFAKASELPPDHFIRLALDLICNSGGESEDGFLITGPHDR